MYSLIVPSLIVLKWLIQSFPNLQLKEERESFLHRENRFLLQDWLGRIYLTVIFPRDPSYEEMFSPTDPTFKEEAC